MAATREMYISRTSVWITWPNTDWPTWAALYARPAHGLAHDLGGQVTGRDGGEAATVFADRGPDGG